MVNQYLSNDLYKTEIFIISFIENADGIRDGKFPDDKSVKVSIT